VIFTYQLSSNTETANTSKFPLGKQSVHRDMLKTADYRVTLTVTSDTG